MFLIYLSTQEIGWAVLSAGWECHSAAMAGTVVISKILRK